MSRADGLPGPHPPGAAVRPAGRVRAWLVGLLAVLMLALSPAPAQAHADLQSSDPADGATLATAPRALVFTFNEDVLDQGNAVTLTDVATQVRLEVGPVAVDGRTVSVAWPSASPAGEFRAAYRVVSADGHPIEGTITFTVEQPVGQVQASPLAGPAQDSASAAASPAPSGSTESASPAPAPDEGSGSGSSGPVVWFIALGIAVVLGAGAGTWVMRKTR